MFRRVLSALSLIVALGGMAQADEKTPRQITVTGQGQVAAVPDMALITLGVTHESEAARDAMAQTSAAVGDILDRMVDLGLDARDLQTQRLTLNPVWSNYRSSKGEKARITGFVASNSVQVRLRDLEDLGRVLDAVIAEGANEFNGLRFSLQDPAPMMRDARRAAVKDAMDKAALLADAAGVPLGALLSISDHGGSGVQPMAAEMSARGAAPIAQGEVNVSASVSMVFAIGE